ncbi:MAG TPA: hypothetical protein DEB06_09120 [Phycisphaerales bacterium]|nr:hypothetical protein [Phycisphaerales bacterium]
MTTHAPERLSGARRAAHNLRRGRGAPSPLWPALALTFANSLGSAVAATGVYFVAERRYGWTERDNLLLALLYGVTYFLGAAGSGGVLRLAERRSGLLTPRRLFMLISVLMGLVAFLPAALEEPWTLWVFMGVYSPLSGVMWPLVEAYLASGRAGARLRSAMGQFNIAWASAIVGGLWMIAPLIEHAPLMTLSALGVIHLAGLALIALLPARPGAHAELTLPPGTAAPDDADPRRARRLLTAFRILLFFAFILMSALSPRLPDRLRSLGVGADWRTPLVSVWAITRLALFILLERWHGWHGRWRTAIWSGGALAIGFLLAAFAPSIAFTTIGLALFGIGFGGAYTAALYYAMFVGNAEVDAGGKHEAIIGLGYTLGPLIALALHALLGAS